MLKSVEIQDWSAYAHSRLPEEVQNIFRERGVLREYQVGSVLMPPGDKGDRIRLIVSGQASVCLRENGRREFSVDILGPGDVFGEISFLTGRPSPANWEIVADDRCEVLEITGEEFSSILEEHPELSRRLLQNLAWKVIQLDRGIFESKLKRHALHSLISREQYVFPDYVIGNYVQKHLAGRLEELANSRGPMLLAGEPGVGKEVLAHALFSMSRQYNEVFLLLDLLRPPRDAPLPVEGEENDSGPEDPATEQMRVFFGYREARPDGSLKEVPGHVQLTEDGTLLVRGVEQLEPAVQSALLEAATKFTFRRPDEEKIYRVKFRLIATTEIDSSEITPEGHPLIHGLASRSVTVPPLRKRRREIPGLVRRYVERHSRELRREVPEVPKQTLKALLNYSWPGNDLELSTTLKRAIVVSREGVIRPDDISFQVTRIEGRGKLNLLRFRLTRQAVLSPLYPAILQSAVTPFFFILLGLLFFGPVDPLKNPGSLFSWALGWPALVIGAFFWARFWCTLCPMGTLGKLAKKVISLQRPFPAFLKNHSDYVVAFAVIFIIWLESATHMRQSPVNVGLLLLTITILSVTFSVIFERQSWCRYLCPLGGMTGLLAKASILELRADQHVCASQCASHECYFGNGERPGCPFGQVTPTLDSNLHCTVCGTCIKNCPHGAVNLNLRIPGQELLEVQRINTGTAFLVMSMMGGLLSELISKTPMYAHLDTMLALPEIGRFTLMFLLVVLGVNLMAALASACSQRVSGETFQENFSRYGLALLPLTLTAFISFHLYYLINLGVQLPILVSQNFDLAVFRQLIITVPSEVTLFWQRLVIVAGTLWSLAIMYWHGRASSGKRFPALMTVLPHAILAVILAETLFVLLKAAMHP